MNMIEGMAGAPVTSIQTGAGRLLAGQSVFVPVELTDARSGKDYPLRGQEIEMALSPAGAPADGDWEAADSFEQRPDGQKPGKDFAFFQPASARAGAARVYVRVKLEDGQWLTLRAGGRITVESTFGPDAEPTPQDAISEGISLSETVPQ